MWFKKIKDAFFKTTESSRSRNRKTILVVEDSKVDQALIVSILRRKGWIPLLAEDGESGLKIAKEEKPDLVLLDFKLPGISGKDVCQALKNNAKTKSIPIIFLTGKDTPDHVIDCYEVGADYYLAKPLNASSLIHQMELTFQEQETSSVS